MNKPRYLKLLAIVEEGYKPITGRIAAEKDVWDCENVMSIKLKNDFSVINGSDFWDDLREFLESVLTLAAERSDE